MNKWTVDVQYAAKSQNTPSYEDFLTWLKPVEASLNEELNKKHAVELCLRLVDNEEMTALNEQYRGKQGSTNVLSFPADSPDKLPANIPKEEKTDLLGGFLGDIVICVEVVQQEALQQQKPLAAHWAHLFIHGILHLAGYDHINDQDAAIMERLETELLAQLNYSAPYSNLNDKNFSHED